MPTSNSHPQEETLELYLLELLDEGDSEEIEIHLLLCPFCQQRTTEGEEQIAVIRTALSPEKE